MLYESVKNALENGAFKAFHPLPDIDERTAWESLDANCVSELMKNADELLSSSPAPLSASLVAEFSINGLRKNFERNYFQRRKNLYALCVLECVENKGRFLDRIIDYAWAICEESCWVIPAHMHQNPRCQGEDLPLPTVDTSCNYIDLFCAETASVLSWCKYLVGARLNKYPMVCERISYEIKRRVLDDLKLIPQMHWSGFVPGRSLNNWTPWICSNLIPVALLEETDTEKRDKWLTLLSQSIDRFLSTYAPDGGCDEGPGYFNRAGASVLDTLEVYYAASGGKTDIWQNALIWNMASYIMHAHIDGEYYINFADAGCRVRPDALLLKRCALFMGDEALKTHAEYLLSNGLAAPAWNINYDGIYRRLKNLFDYRSASCRTPLPQRALSHYFEGIQVFCARQSADTSGLYMAVKGGHNAESHNHNDIGNYIIYANSEPLIVDAGVETYSKKTFSSERYDIWTMRSAYHNTAVIGGLEQKNGREYAAKDACAFDDGTKAVFKLDMAGAYDLGDKAKYIRTLALNRDKGTIELTDNVDFAEAKVVALPLLLARKPEITHGKATLCGESTNLIISFDPEAFETEFDEIEIGDPVLRANWQREKLYRLILKLIDPIRRCKLELRFSAAVD